MADFAENLRELIERRRMSQRDLAGLVGVSQPLVSKWVRGENAPKFLMVARIAEVFQVPIEMFVASDIAKVTDREIELRRSLVRAIETIGIEEALRRLLVAGPKSDGVVPLDVKDETASRKVATPRGGPDIGRDTVGRATTVPELAARLAGKPAGRPKGKKKRPKPDGSPTGGVG